MASTTVKVEKTRGSIKTKSRFFYIREMRDSLHMTRAVFARLAECTERTVADWESDKKEPRNISLQRITELRRLVRELQRLMPEGSIGEWLSEPNDAFSGLKPLEVIERGETDRLWRMVYELNSGEPG
ncbi:MAG: helix-turn-helix domain-containing protein [Spirochaetales bacterium]|nr:helix-turn-helix domain-containing protein [Spirochaetales bacterium]